MFTARQYLLFSAIFISRLYFVGNASAVIITCTLYFQPYTERAGSEEIVFAGFIQFRTRKNDNICIKHNSNVMNSANRFAVGYYLFVLYVRCICKRSGKQTDPMRHDKRRALTRVLTRVSNQARKSRRASPNIRICIETFNMTIDANHIKYRFCWQLFRRLNHRRSTPSNQRDYVSIESSKSEQLLWLSRGSRFIGLHIRPRIIGALSALPRKKSNVFCVCSTPLCIQDSQIDVATDNIGIECAGSFFHYIQYEVSRVCVCVFGKNIWCRNFYVISVIFCLSFGTHARF